jgi:purine-binding chemotaxis protein CheW
MEKQLVIFELGTEHFGIDIESVEGINKILDITKVPQAPACVEGVANLRGQIIPVVDLHRRFGMANSEKTNQSRIVVANVGSTKIGMIVSAVSEVLTIDDSCIENPPSMVCNINSSYIIGIANIDDRLIILLDLAKVLTIEEQTQVAGIKIQ